MKKITGFLLIAFCLASFSSLSVSTAFADLEISIDKNKEKDFGTYKTFAWLPQDLWMKHMKKQPNPQIYKIVTQAVNKDLIAKGYKEVPFAEADLIAVYTGSLEHKEAVSKVGFGHGQEYFGARMRVNQMGNVRNLPPAAWDERSYDSYYSEGKLILDFYERQTKDLVWRGTGLKKIEMDTPVMQIEEKNLTKSIDTLMKKFPEAE